MWTLPGLLSGRVRRRAEIRRGLVGVPAVQRRTTMGQARGLAHMVHKVRYRGSPASVGVFDALLRDEGLRVDHREIADRQGVQDDLVDVVVYVSHPDGELGLDATSDVAITSGIETAIAKLRASVPRAQAQIVVTRNQPLQR